MNAKDTKSPSVFPASWERIIILVLCFLAAYHVFIFSAAFPPINNVDESAHLDLAVKYSHGHLPRGMELRSRETLNYVVVYGSQEFLYPPDYFPEGKLPPPLWTQPPEQVWQIFLARETAWQSPNHESSQPPIYYSLAGFWWKTGTWLGFKGGGMFYWLRFLNTLAVAALVWLGYTAARRIFPEQLFLRLGVPALLAFLPQTAFYSVNNDVLSPLSFGVAFICLVRLWQADSPDIRLGFATGLALAAAWLTKPSNLPLLAVSAVFVAVKIGRLSQSGKLRASLPSLVAMFLCAALPTSAWAAWCKIHFGDFTGSAGKIQFLGWTLKPFSEWWHHPIFTPHGAWTFLSGLLASFWQGEFFWHGRPLTSPVIDVIYTLISIGFVAVAVAVLMVRPMNTAAPQRQALWFGLAGFAASVAFLAFLSLIYDFHDCVNPSREHPYFTSGRLLLGALVPFILLFVFGMDRALCRFGTHVKFLVLAGVILFMIIAEFTTDWPVFSSQYNWFHM